MTFRRLISLIPYSLSLRVMRYFAVPIVVIVAALAIRVGYAAWVEPAVGPIGGTPPPPINTSSVVQTKTGGLNIATVSGNVGIGTTSPGAKLEVADQSAEGTKYGSLQITRQANNNANTQLYLSMIRAGNTVGGLGFVPNTNNWGLFNWNTSNPALIISGGNVGIGTTNPAYRLDVNGGGRANYLQDNIAGWYVDADVTSRMNNIDLAGTIYANNWFRSRGNSGWYSETYGGGWFMQDTTWIRAYNNKNVYTPGQIEAGTLQGDNANILQSNGGTVVVRNDGGNVYLWPWGTGAASSNIILGGGVGGIGLNATGPIYEMSGNRVCTAANGVCPVGISQVFADARYAIWDTDTRGFEGMWSNRGATCFSSNPFTGGCSCPAGFTLRYVATGGESGFNINNVDIYYCYR